MDRESVNRLRFDRRLEHRRGWVEEAAKEAHLESLPDVTEKLTRGLDEPEESPTDAERAGPESLGTISYSTPDPASVPAPGSSGTGGSEPS